MNSHLRQKTLFELPVGAFKYPSHTAFSAPHGCRKTPICTSKWPLGAASCPRVCRRGVPTLIPKRLRVSSIDPWGGFLRTLVSGAFPITNVDQKHAESCREKMRRRGARPDDKHHYFLMHIRPYADGDDHRINGGAGSRRTYPPNGHSEELDNVLVTPVSPLSDCRRGWYDLASSFEGSDVFPIDDIPWTTA